MATPYIQSTDKTCPSATVIRRPAQDRGGRGLKRLPAAAAAASSADGPINIQMIPRGTPPERREAFSMLDGHYLFVCTAKRSPSYKEIIDTIMTEIKNNTIAATKTAAKERFDELIAAD